MLLLFDDDESDEDTVPSPSPELGLGLGAYAKRQARQPSKILNEETDSNPFLSHEEPNARDDITDDMIENLAHRRDSANHHYDYYK